MISWHFRENNVILVQMVAKLRCIKLCAIFFLDHYVEPRGLRVAWVFGHGRSNGVTAIFFHVTESDHA